MRKWITLFASAGLLLLAFGGLFVWLSGPPVNVRQGAGIKSLEQKGRETSMTDRFAELLAKSKASQLSAEETEELARILNAPILETLRNPPTGFVSKHKMAETDVASRIKAIDWFAKCGEPTEFSVTMQTERVKTWPQAMQACSTVTWENVQLEARNQLSMALHSRDRERFRNWNSMAGLFKEEVVTPLSMKIWQPYQVSRGLDIKLVHCVR